MKEQNNESSNTFECLPPFELEDDASIVQDRIKGYFQQEKRLDGRNFYEIRPIFIRTNVSSKASGSCYLSQKNTSVLCSVFGPKPLSRNTARETRTTVEKGSLTFEVTLTPLCQRRLKCNTGTNSKTFELSRGIMALRRDEERRLTNCLAETFQSIVLFEHLPYASIVVHLIVIYNDGGLTSAAINCVSVALTDAGIPLKDVCVSITIALLPKPESLNTEKDFLNDTEHLNSLEEDKRTDESQGQELLAQRSNPDLDNFFILIDPTDKELHLLSNKFYFPSSNFSDDKFCACVFYLAFCTSDSTVAFLDIQGAFRMENLTSILGPAEYVCLQIACEFKKQLRQQLNHRRKTNHLEACLANQLFQRIKPFTDIV